MWLMDGNYPERFEKLWSVYPRKIEKKRAFTCYKATMRRGEDHSDLERATRNYAEARQGEEMRFIKHPATFWGPNEPWKDWVRGDPDRPEDTIACMGVCARCGGDMEVPKDNLSKELCEDCEHGPRNPS